MDANMKKKRTFVKAVIKDGIAICPKFIMQDKETALKRAWNPDPKRKHNRHGRDTLEIIL